MIIFKLYVNYDVDKDTKVVSVKHGLLTKLIRQADNNVSSIIALRQENSESKIVIKITS